MTRAQRQEAERHWISLLRREWQRREEQCLREMEAARAAGDFIAFRQHREHWLRYWSPGRRSQPAQ